MLPSNRLRVYRMDKLKIFPEQDHPYKVRHAARPPLCLGKTRDARPARAGWFPRLLVPAAPARTARPEQRAGGRGGGAGEYWMRAWELFPHASPLPRFPSTPSILRPRWGRCHLRIVLHSHAC